MSELESKNKKELVAIIQQMSEKLKELKPAEAKLESLESDLPGTAFSVFQKNDRTFHIAEVGYNSETGAAKVLNIKDLDTKTYETAMYLTKKYLVETIMKPEQLNHLKKGE